MSASPVSLLTQTQATDVCKMAHDHAQDFINNSGWDPAQGFYGIYGKINAFIRRKHHLCAVPRPQLATAGFYAWIEIIKCQITNKKYYNIAFSKDLMEKAEKSNIMPLYLQQLRCYLHEFGHTIISPHLLIPSGKGNEIISLPDEEEEKAWLFAFSYMSILLGHHAHWQRYSGGADQVVLIPV